jgi:hypothetical protein
MEIIRKQVCNELKSLIPIYDDFEKKTTNEFRYNPSSDIMNYIFTITEIKKMFLYYKYCYKYHYKYCNYINSIKDRIYDIYKCVDQLESMRINNSNKILIICYLKKVKKIYLLFFKSLKEYINKNKKNICNNRIAIIGALKELHNTKAYSVIPNNNQLIR